jgi:hypothetical protein
MIFHRVGVSYGYTEGGGGVCYDESLPHFENICGGVSVVNSAHIADAVASMEELGRSGGCNVLKRSRTAFGVCFELFTVYGNVTLRRDRHAGGTVSFKGAR